jgi:hypothetical protein
LDDSEICARLREGGAKAVAQSMRMPGRHAGTLAVVAEDAAQPGSGERLAPVRALQHHEQRPCIRLGSLGQEVGLDEAGNVGIERNPPLLVAFSNDAYPSSPDVDVFDLEAKSVSG